MLSWSWLLPIQSERSSGFPASTKGQISWGYLRVIALQVPFFLRLGSIRLWRESMPFSRYSKTIYAVPKEDRVIKKKPVQTSWRNSETRTRGMARYGAWERAILRSASVWWRPERADFLVSYAATYFLTRIAASLSLSFCCFRELWFFSNPYWLRALVFGSRDCPRNTSNHFLFCGSVVKRLPFVRKLSSVYLFSDLELL